MDLESVVERFQLDDEFSHTLLSLCIHNLFKINNKIQSLPYITPRKPKEIFRYPIELAKISLLF